MSDICMFYIILVGESVLHSQWKVLVYSTACDLRAFHISTGTGERNKNSWTPFANLRMMKAISLRFLSVDL